jgi:hypothetical protein
MVLLVGWAVIWFVAFIVFQGFVMLIHLVWGSSPARPDPDSLIAFILAWPALDCLSRREAATEYGTSSFLPPREGGPFY